ncbi:hypothetical protein RI367_001452 [Sorochytrium milnesiophthora]
MPSCAVLSLLTVLVLSAVVSASPIHQAAGVKKVVTFGDSLTDVGNGTFPATNFTYPPAPYFKGRYSNGQIWIEYLTQTLGASLTSYAVGGATSVNANDDAPPRPIPSVNDQINEFVRDFPTLTPACSTLYMMWIGSNDLFYKGANLTTPEQVNTLTSAPQLVGDYINRDLNFLISSVTAAHKANGGKAHIALLNIPTVERVPAWHFAHSADQISLMADVAHKTNARIASDLQQTLTQQNAASHSPRHGSPNDARVSVSLVDVNSIFADVLSHPQQYGFSDATNPCLVTDPVTGAPGAECANPDDHTFWDNFHPTTKAHKVLAGKIQTALQKELDQIRC